MVHDREAHQGILDVLRAEGAPDRVIFHCFSGDAELARAC
jgi:TatD DNase family protein